MSKYILFMVLSLVTSYVSSYMLNATNLPDEQRLLHDLLADYDKTARPRYDSNHQVVVETRFSLQQIYDLDEKRQILTISGWLTAEWTDELLVWDAGHYGNLSSVVVDPRTIWTPKMAIGNSARKMFEDWRHFCITVRSDGRARWQPGGIFTFTCALNMNYYPFDEQICTMELETWFYTSDMVNMTMSMDTFGLETYLENGEWAVVNTKVEREDQVYHYYNNEAFPEVYLTIHLRRKYVFYFLYILLPCMMLSFVLLMMFVLPAECGEKVSLGVSLLVSFCVFLLIVAEQVPDTSDAVPIIAVYLMYFMLMTSLSVMAAASIVRLHHSGMNNPMPPWLRYLTFTILAKAMGLKQVKRFLKRHGNCTHYSQRSYTSQNEPDKMQASLPNRIVPVERLSDAIAAVPLSDEADQAFSFPSRGVLCDVSCCGLSELEFQVRECKMAAYVLDRFFFLCFLVILCLPVIALICLAKIFD